MFPQTIVDGKLNIIEPVHEISNNVVCATSKASDQPAYTHSLIRAFACRLNILWLLTLNAPIATKVVCFSRLLKCLRSLYGKQCGPRSDCSYRAVCSGSTLFASILNSSVMLGNYLQQTTSSDDIFRCIFFLGALRVKLLTDHYSEFLSLKGGCTGSSESTLVKLPHCWKSHVVAHYI